MATVKLQSNLESRKNSKVVLPIVGTVEFKNGVIEVDVNEVELKHLLDIQDLSVVHGNSEDKKIKPQVEENELGKAEDEKNDIGANEDEADILGKLDLAGLQCAAKQAGFDEKDWGKLNEAELREFLTKQLQA